MTMLDVMTWIRFAVWIAIGKKKNISKHKKWILWEISFFAGLLIYFLYGLWHSEERHSESTTPVKENGISLVSDANENLEMT